VPGVRQALTALKGLAEAGAVLTALFSVATIFDNLHQYLELFSHFRLQYLAVAVLLLTFFALVRSRRYLLLMAAVAILNAWYVVPWYLPQSDTAQSSQSFTIVLANVLRSNGEHKKLSALLSAEAPDFVFVQEVTDGWAKHVGLLQAYPYRHVVPDNGSFGIAVLSRFPLTNVQTVDSPPFGFATIVAATAINGRNITFTTTHPMPPLGRIGYDGRNEQLAHIAELVNAQSGPRLLIGDLNTSMWGANYRRLVSATGLRNARSGFGVLPTWPTHIPIAYIPIDHCLISPELEVISIRTGPNIGSDHLPLIVTLSLN
jgi:endonuclease/exonuclease/phosphatase (EEP) superfamily protein YafD